VITARRIEKKGHAAQGRREMYNCYWSGSQQNKEHIEDIGIYERVTLQ